MRRLAAGVLALCAACTDPDAPRLSDVTPDEAPPGATVVITGENLCGTAVSVGEGGACEPLPAGYVSFGIDPQVDGVIVAWADARIEAIVPAAASGEVLIVVTVDGRSSNGISFTVR
jgi:hypothetical protein